MSVPPHATQHDSRAYGTEQHQADCKDDGNIVSEVVKKNRISGFIKF